MEALNNVLALLTQIAATTSDKSTIGKIIGGLAEAAPLAVKEYKDVAPSIKNIVRALRGNGATGPEQLNELAALDKIVDDAFEAAAAAAEAEDAAAERAPAPKG